MKDPAIPERIGTIDVSSFGLSVNSVDAADGVVAMAVRYITVDQDSGTGYVTLQENNALAIVDIPSATVRQVVPLGYKDHRVVPLDASDRDGPGNGPLINIRTWPVPLFGMYQPDGIASYTVSGRTYLVTANEGDSRSWAGFTEDVRVSALPHPLNPAIFTNEPLA